MLGLNILLSFMVHIVIIACFYKVLKEHYKTQLTCIVFSSISSFILMMSGMLLLSVFNALNRSGLMIFYLIVVVLLCGIALFQNKNRKKKAANTKIEWNYELLISVSIIVILFIILGIWGLNYYDTTDDALTQGYPKLYFIMQHQSLFVNYPTETPNIFCNEWLSELNCLYYLLMTGRDQAAIFGNFEILLLTILIFFWAPQYMSREQKNRYPILALSLSTLLVVLGLATTIKTDLFSVGMLLFSTVCIYQYYRNENAQELFWAIIAIALAMASKISLLPGAGLLLIMLIIHFIIYDKKKKEKVPYIISAGAVSFLICNRYILNMIYYGTFFKRAENEKISLSFFDNLTKSFKGILSGFNELLVMIPAGKYGNWSLIKALGSAGWIWGALLIVALIILIKSHSYQKIKKVLWYIDVPLLLGLIFFCSTTTWFGWSYRYIIAYLIVFFVQAYILVFENILNEKTIVKQTINGCLIIAACFNIYSCLFVSGQILPYSMQDASNLNWIEKKLYFSSWIKSNFFMENEEVRNVLEHEGKGLIYLGFSAPSSPLFGENGCVTIDLVDDCYKLLEHEGYDFYAIVDPANNEGNNYNDYVNYFEKEDYKAFCGDYIYMFISEKHIEELRAN